MAPRVWRWNSPLAPPAPTALRIELTEPRPSEDITGMLAQPLLREVVAMSTVAPKPLLPALDQIIVFHADPKLYWPDTPAGVRVAERYYAGRHHFLCTDEAIDTRHHPHGWWLDDGSYFA